MAWLGSRNIFVCATVNLEKFGHGMPLSKVNHAVDGGLLLLAPIRR